MTQKKEMNCQFFTQSQISLDVLQHMMFGKSANDTKIYTIYS